MPIINMISNLAEEFPEGAHCPFHWNRPDDRAVNTVVVYSTHQGLCLHEREANFHDDSDFYMTVWNVERAEPEELCFGSTRGWTYPCMGSSVDATEEVRTAYQMWLEERDRQSMRDSRSAKARRLLALRTEMHDIAERIGLSVYAEMKIRALRQKLSSTEMEAIIKLFARRIRSSFKLSLRQQVASWSEDYKSDYEQPLSRKQLDCISRDYRPN